MDYEEVEVEDGSTHFRLFEIKIKFDNSQTPNLIRDVVGGILNNFIAYRISVSDEIDRLFNLKNKLWRYCTLGNLLEINQHTPKIELINRKVDTKRKMKIFLGRIGICNGELFTGNGGYSLYIDEELYILCDCKSKHKIPINVENPIETLNNINLIPKSRNVYNIGFYSEYVVTHYDDTNINLDINVYYNGKKIDVIYEFYKYDQIEELRSFIDNSIEKMKNVHLYSSCKNKCAETGDDVCSLHIGFYSYCNYVLIVEDKYKVVEYFSDFLRKYLDNSDFLNVKEVSIINPGKRCAF